MDNLFIPNTKPKGTKLKILKCYVEIEGETPLLIHNGRTSNPLDEFSKKMKLITSKKKKTEEDLEKLLDIQWHASLYWNDKIGLYMPVENIQASLYKACKKHKMGNNVSGFVFGEKLGFPILVEGHESMEALEAKKEYRFVKAVTIQRAKTLSCRAMFEKWALNFNFEIDQSIIGEEDVSMILATMSKRIGLGVWTPSHPKPGNFGKFLLKSVEFKNE